MKRHVGLKWFLYSLALITAAAPAWAQTVAVTPTSLDFGSEFDGFTTNEKHVFVENLGPGVLTFTSVVASSSFIIETSNCVGTVPSGFTCSMWVAFAPSTPGAVNGTLTISDSAATSPQTVSLTGMGLAPVPVAFQMNSSPTSVTTKDTSDLVGDAIMTVTGPGVINAGSVIEITFNTALSGLPTAYCFANGCNPQQAASGNVLSLTFPVSLDFEAGNTIRITGGVFNPNSFGIGTVTATASNSLGGAATFSPTTVPVAIVSGSSVVGLSASSLDFGDVLVGEGSTQTLTLANVGNGTLSIGGFAIKPASPANFSESNNCGNSLAPGTGCTINVTFTPHWTGLITALLSVATQTVSLAGTGSGPIASLSVTSLDFGSHNVGSSAVLPVTLTNTGSAPLTIGGIATNIPAFTQTNNCPGSLAPSAICTISVSFTPSASGSFSGSLTITDNGLAGAQTVALVGFGSGLAITLSPTGLNFGDQRVGTSSPPQTLTLTNSGAVALSISAIASTFSPFVQSNNCPASLAPGAGCAFTVTFTPTGAGPFRAFLTISDNAIGGPQLAALSGTGFYSGGLSLSKPSLDFGSQPIGKPGSSQTVSLVNIGTAPDAISSITTTSPVFSQTNNCVGSLAVGATCTVSVTFTTSATATVLGSLKITDSTSGTPQLITLSGAGFDPTKPVPPPSFNFGNQPIGTTSPAIQFRVVSGSSPLLDVSNRITPDEGVFVRTTNCPVNPQTAFSCTINVRFSPKAPVTYSGLLGLDNLPESVTLTGTGVPLSGPVSNLSAVLLEFQPQQVNSTASPQFVALSNTGAAPLNITSISTKPSEFAQANNCPSSLAPGDSCAIDVLFTPTASITTTGFLTITDNATDSPKQLSLVGVGALQSGPLPVISPTALSFGYQVAGTTSGAQTLQIANNALTPIEITSIGASSGFGATSACPASLAPDAKCNVSVTFNPTEVGMVAGSLYVAINLPASIQTVALTGAGVSPGPVASVSPASLKFGNQLVTTPSSPQSVMLSNTGTAALAITSIAFSSDDFVENHTCGSSLAMGATCTVVVMFNPTAAGPLTGSLIITDNGPGSPQTVALTGTGTPNPSPVLGVLSPSARPPGSAGVNLTVIGTNFVFSSVVQWNGSNLATTYMSSTELTAFVPASDLAYPGSLPVTVSNPAPGGGVSNALTFKITAAASTPIPGGAVQTIVPHSAFGGGWITRLFVANLTNAPNAVTINRIDQSGNVIASDTTTLGPTAMVLLADDESLRGLPLTINWFAIGSKAPVIASVLFDFQGAVAPTPVNFNTAVGALASPAVSSFTALARVTSPGGDLGLALANLSNTSNKVTIKLYDEGGNLVAQDSVILGAYSQTAFDLTQDAAFSNILQSTDEFVGTLMATTSDPTKPVSALVVGANLNQLFSLPVVSGVAK
jgi:hypothetical protein